MNKQFLIFLAKFLSKVRCLFMAVYGIYIFLMTNFIILIELKKNFFCEHMIGKILLANGDWGQRDGIGDKG